MKLKNKLLATLSCAALLLTLVPVLPAGAEGKVLFEDNFTNYTAGVFTKDIAQSHGYSLVTALATPAVSIAKEGSEQFLQITAARPYIRIPGPSGGYTMRFDVMRNVASSGLFEIWIADLAEDSTQNLRLRIHENGSFGILDSKTGKNYFAQTVGGFSNGGYNANRTDSGNLLLDANVWYTVEFTVVPGSAGVDLKLTKRGSAAAVFEGTASLPAFAAGKYVQLDGQDYAGSTINISIDNIKITEVGASGSMPVAPATGGEFAVQNFESFAAEAGYDGDDVFSLAVIAGGGEAKRTVKEETGNKYLLMTTQNTASTTETVRNRFRTKSTIGGTYTVEWDARNDSGVRFETYLRTAGSVRVRQMNHKLYLAVENNAKVTGVMETVTSKVALQDGKWYTFKTEVSNEKIVLTFYDKSNQNSLLDTLTIKQDNSTLTNLLDPYQIWFDMWGVSKENTTLQSVALDNICITQGTYTGVKSAPRADESGQTPNAPSQAGEAKEVYLDFEDYSADDRFVDKTVFVGKDQNNGGLSTRLIRNAGKGNYLQMLTANTKGTTGRIRNRLESVTKFSGTYTAEWDYCNVGAKFARMDTYLRFGGNVRVSVFEDGVPHVRVLDAVAVSGAMESVKGNEALKGNVWYTFKAAVTDDELVVEIYNKQSGTLVERMTTGQDASTDARLYDPCTVWFDMWGSADLTDSAPLAVALDNVRLTAGTYEGLRNSAISAAEVLAPEVSEEEEGAYSYGYDGFGVAPHDNCPSADYLDVYVNAWYHNAVDYVLTNKLMGGYNAYLFGTRDTLTRAQVVQVLYNKEGQPDVSGGNKFPDVKSGDWFNNAVTWGSQKGVVGGYGNGYFGPNDAVTLQQIAVILWNYSGNPDFTGTPDSVGPYDSWAKNGLSWAVENGILDGVPYETVTEPASRAQTAQMLMNFLKK